MISWDYVGHGPADSRIRRARALEARRTAERADALDFLLNGDEGGRHSDVCVHALRDDEPCSREYDPLPYPSIKSRSGRIVVTARQQALPAKETMYVGTGVGALYELPDTEGHLWQLAGWNVGAQS